MRLFRSSILTLLLLTVTLVANGQMELSDLTGGDKQPLATFADSIRVQRIESDNYFSQARYRYERHLLRVERNYLEINSALQGSLTNLSESWIETSGGDNSMTLLASLYIKHNYTKDLFSLQTTFNAKFGYYRMALEEKLDDGSLSKDHVWFKNQDEFQIEVAPSLKMSKNWSYGATLKFRSQFAKGYVSSASQKSFNLKSDFLSPGYLDISGGLIYTCPIEKLPFKITLSPLAMSTTYVKNATVRDNSQYNYTGSTDKYKYVKPYGVDPYSSANYEGGSSVQVNFDRKFGKNDFLRYTTTIFSFYGWMAQLTHKHIYSTPDEYDVAIKDWEDSGRKEVEPMLSIRPTIRWENKVEVKASKYISTTLNFQLYYNRAQSLEIQTQTLLSVGLSYTFANKTL